IRESQVPIAAPSANLAGRPSPTTAEHVRQDLSGWIDMILDAGPTNVGVESTVLDLTVDPPQILRPGGVSYERLKEVLGRVEFHPDVIADRRIDLSHARSPGMKHRHYAPNAEMIVVEGELCAVVEKTQELADRHKKSGKKVGILTTDENKSLYRADVVKSLGSRKDMSSVARNLFKTLREFEAEKVDMIIAEGVAPNGLGLAVINRLRKASGFNIVRAEKRDNC
ncbi:MAG: Sua5 family C-terminal domain-containing protein, partial [Candidatus Bathyarchaeia archaeon]